jgi:hypothetical protein
LKGNLKEEIFNATTDNRHQDSNRPWRNQEIGRHKESKFQTIIFAGSSNGAANLNNNGVRDLMWDREGG